MNHYEQKDTILHAENVSVVYGEKTIIKDINFLERDTVRPGKVQGQVIAFLGRSGRGKSTLFRVITGLNKPTTGSVLIPDTTKQPIDGKIPAKDVKEGDVGFVDQKYTLFRHKTVYQALTYAMRNAASSKAEKHDKIMRYLVEWGLEKAKDQYPNELSGGQRQRTAILEQLLSSGNYIVMDEPFSGLDIGNIMNVKTAFRLINESNDLNTIIFSTHDIELAVELADSLYVIGYPRNADGKLESYGTILHHYDLKQMGIAWQDGFNERHRELAEEVKQALLSS